jgi:hypothetical protein
LPKIWASVVDEIRGYVAACGSNTLGPAGTLPPRLIAAALAIFRHRAATRLPGMSGLIDDLRQREYDDALRQLRDVAACRFAVEEPAGDATSSGGGASPLLAQRPSHFGRQAEDGI